MQNLGYEKYAGIFEEAKIGMLELPYLSEERLEKLGIPLGPRIRILQVGLHNFAHNQNRRSFISFPGGQDTLQPGWTKLQCLHPLAFRRLGNKLEISNINMCSELWSQETSDKN